MVTFRYHLSHPPPLLLPLDGRIRLRSMKATTTTAVPSARGPFYSKKRASPASLTKRSDARRTPTDPNVELERQSAVQLALASREMQALLEMDYQDDVRAYMSKMEVSLASLILIPHLTPV